MKCICLYVLVLFIVSTNCDDTKQIHICDSPLDGNPPTMYIDYIKSLYQQGFSITPIVQRTDCFQYDDLNKGLDIAIIVSVAAVSVATGGATAIGGGGLMAGGLAASEIIQTQKNIDYSSGIVDINARKEECRRIQDNINNANKGVSLVVNWPITYLILSLINTNSIASILYEQYTEQILTVKFNTHDSSQLHDFVSKNGQSVVWTSITFDMPAGYDKDLAPYCNYDVNTVVVPGSKRCIHPFFRFSDQFFKTSQTFTSTGFKEYAGYINFDKNLYTGMSKKLIQVKDIEGNLKWGILMSGCSPPTFHVRVVWEEYNHLNCNRPVITVTNIIESESFICKRGFTTNILRSKISSSTTTLDQRKNSEEFLSSNIFTVHTSSPEKVIFISNSHAKTISHCIFPDVNYLSKWDGWSETAAGKCVSCSGSTPSSYISRIPRACNMNLDTEKNMDCCFDCVKDYTQLTYVQSIGVTVEHCIKTCLLGYVYDDILSITPKCVQCPTGKYSQRGDFVCRTCQELGVSNAIINKKNGCITCGSRAEASLDASTCIPCAPQEYVPTNSSRCVTCPYGSILVSTESQTCTPCSPGYEFSTGKCVLCQMSYFKAERGGGLCIPCPYATRSAANRSVCVECNSLNKTLAPLAMYKTKAASCEVTCNLTISYAYTSNPYTVDGCRPCSDRPPPIGTYPIQGDCTSFLPCTAITPMMVFTGYGEMGNSSSCTWTCKNGYYKSMETMCIPCQTPTFNASLHVYTLECAFDCIPGLYYRGTPECKDNCINLINDKSIYSKLSDYYRFLTDGSKLLYTSSRPDYILGQCGSDDKDPSSSLPLLRKVGIYAYVNPTQSGIRCGNYILNKNEECDDGNVIPGDGCSSLCQIERNGYWDCDIIGEPCKPLCGWNTLPIDSLGVGLNGFVFDPRNASAMNIPLCSGVTYTELLRIPLPYSRRQWMQDNLISCECAINPMQVLPYSECNYTNRGCRGCLSDNYMDDLYARCSPCGSACSVGFRSYNASKDDIQTTVNADIQALYGFIDSLHQCGPRISTSKMLSYADPVDNPYLFGRDQIMIGCVPCSIYPNTRDMVVFVTGEGTCNWVCKRDPANQTDADYFCLNSNNRICNGACKLCDKSLELTNISLGFKTYSGKYITSCNDLTGHTIGDCSYLDATSNAHYTGNSRQIVADQHGCPWECNTGYQRFQDSSCHKCDRTTCQQKEMLVACNAGGYHCASCVSVKGIVGLRPMEMWYSLPDFSDCIPDCEDGLAFRNHTETCQQCTQENCMLNELYIPCTLSHDSSCIPCGELEINMEFYMAGTCNTRCTSGYAQNEYSLCLLCSDIHCTPGHHLEYSCINEMERDRLPQCVDCTGLPNDPMRIWENECDTSCMDGWMFQSDLNHTCIPCKPDACEVGLTANCRNALVHCSPCPISIEILALGHMKYIGRGNCTTACISSEYILSGDNYCSLKYDPNLQQNSPSQTPLSSVESYGVDLLTINNDVNVSLLQAVVYPTRNIPHSAYTV